MLAAGVPAVLAMQDLMPIDTGRAFTRALYGELWAGGEVDRAANRARATLLTGGLRGSAVPVLYSALADNRLFIPRAAAGESRGLFIPRIAGSEDPDPGQWQVLGGPYHGVCAGRGRDGCVELFAVDAASAQLHVRRQEQPGGPWGAWRPRSPGSSTRARRSTSAACCRCSRSVPAAR
ncbi:hypothetical protein [Nannocystis pusilla]|uniref:hypothetical protein n=1 Tax=Nannocystis pusilla TaxID=889268 RepID=UPI003B790E2D